VTLTLIYRRTASGWLVTVPELPGCVGRGPTRADARHDVRLALAGRLWGRQDVEAVEIHAR
jgi:predicted RNase H-like HicB family nuclease